MCTGWEVIIFSTSNPKEFGRQLRLIRVNLKLSQQRVFKETGISEDTLRRLENGQSIPKIETLQKLSSLYRADIITLYGKYQTSKSLLSIYQQSNLLLTMNREEELIALIDTFVEHVYDTMEDLLDHRDLWQAKCYLNGLRKRLLCPTDMSALEDYINALRYYSPQFSLSSWREQFYSIIELRILFSLASLLSDNKEYEISKSMLIFIMERLDESHYSDYAEKILITNVYAELVYLFHRTDCFDQVYAYAEKGIHFCRDNLLVSYLPLLLYRKGHAMIKMGLPEGVEQINKAIDLLSILDNSGLSQIYQIQRDKLLESELFD